MKLSDIKEFVSQPDGSIKAVTLTVTHELGNGEIVSSAPLQFCKTCGTNTEFYNCWCAKPAPVAIAARCELGEACRCVEGDEPGCWNWVSP